MLKRVGWVLALIAAGCSAAVIDSGAGTSEAPLTGKMPLLPWAGGTGAQTPWGGTDASRWRPEAILANAMSQALNDAWARADVTDAIVAVPVKMQNSGFREFGDGQANAAPSFEWWHESRPPLLATLVRFKSGPATVSFRLDHALPIPTGDFDVRYLVAGAPTVVRLTAQKDGSGDWRADWTLPPEADLGDPRFSTTFLVHPANWADWFPLWFRFPVRPIADLLATVPQGLRSFTDGGGIVDHEGASIQSTGFQGQSVLARLFAHDFRGQYSGPFQPASIHATFPWNGHTYTTGVGVGWTWVANQPPAPFKILYSCFEHRRPDEEAAAPDGGVPSGGGWHRIGDPAETVLNDLEDGPIALGSAMSYPIPGSLLPSGGFAYNLSDVATVRFVQPGEAFITPSGGSFTDGNGTTWDQSNFHWYFFQQSRDVCTEELVHPFRPTASFDFAGPTHAVTFQIDNATTRWGQNVYVVGSSPELGGWDARKAARLSPASYPTWSGTVQVSSGPVQLKFVKVDGAGSVTWESGPNHVIGDGDSSLHASWQ